jgi:hypothetical protein
MTDTEKKIAEIRKSAEEARKTDRSWVEGQDYADDVEFLLDELERERAAHNAHVTELCELGKENRKLLEERDEARSKAEEAWKEIDSLERLREDRDKMIEGLHNYMKELDRRYQKAYRNYDIDCDHHQLGMAEAYEVAERCLRDILKEVGVTVE